MPSNGAARGRLIAVDGASGPETAALALQLLQSTPMAAADAAISVWDASNLFSDMKLDDPAVPGLSPRSLLLCYAADLSFRLRWEIRPALEQGRTVVAAGYVETAIAFGRAAGLSGRWMRELFRIAPRPAKTHVARANGIAPSGPRDGFIEFCCAMLEQGNPPWDAGVLRARIELCLRR